MNKASVQPTVGFMPNLYAAGNGPLRKWKLSQCLIWSSPWGQTQDFWSSISCRVFKPEDLENYFKALAIFQYDSETAKKLREYNRSKRRTFLNIKQKGFWVSVDIIVGKYVFLNPGLCQDLSF